MISRITCFTTALALSGLSAHAADGITHEEYLQMKRELADLRKEVSTLRATKAAPAPTPATPASANATAALSRSFTELSTAVDSLRQGTATTVLTGSAEATFSSARNSPSNFGAAFEPIFLYQISPRLLFEGEMELELDGYDTSLKLEFAQIDWSLNDNLTLIGGKFLNPVNTYVERFAPTWIRKLPDNPLGLYDGFLPESNVGFQLRGVYPVGPSHVNFAAYVSNAPALVTDDPEALGTLQFDNYNSQGDGKAFGGRFGLEIVPQLEVGYGVQYARVKSDSGRSVSSLLQSVDLTSHLDAAKGRFQLLGQYAWSKTGNYTYDSDSALGVGPLNFANNRDGGYVQLSYRGKQWDSDFLNRLEFIVRGDAGNAPHVAPGAFDERRLTFGVDYWLAPATVIKAAYEIDHRNNGELNGDAFLLQLSTGF